ncbi:hypothetical protein GCAAIG_03390 [Candidatus Electronema halotolerans]
MQVKKTVLLASCLPLLFLFACDKPKTEEKPVKKEAVEMNHVEVSKEAVGTEAESASEQPPLEAAEEGAPAPGEQVELPEEGAEQEDMLPADNQSDDELVDAAEQAAMENAQVQDAPPAPEQADEPAAEEAEH